KTAMAIEDDIVRRRQFMPVALAVEDARLAGARIDALDPAALVILGGPRRQKTALSIFVAAIVADIKRAVRAAREPVRPAASRPDRRFAAIRRNLRHLLSLDFAKDDRTVSHCDWAFRKPQTSRHYAYVRHRALLPRRRREFCRGGPQRVKRST